VGSTCQRRFPSARAFSPSPSFKWGRSVGASCPRPCAPFPLCLVGPPRQRTEPFPSHARSLSLRCGTPLSALPSLRPVVDQHTRTRARAPRSPATSPAHTPQLLFEHRLHPHSLPRPISHSLALSRALPSLLHLAGDPRPPCWSPSSPEATPSDPKLRSEVRHPFSCSVSSIMLCRQSILASPEFGHGGPPHPRGDRPNWSGSVPPRWSLISPRSAEASPGPSAPQTPVPATEIPHQNNPDPPGVLPSPFSPL
jgi:hypothetical protein